MSVREKVMNLRFGRNFDAFLSTINRTGTLRHMSDEEIIALAAVELARYGSPLADRMFDISYKQLDNLKSVSEPEVSVPEMSPEEERQVMIEETFRRGW